MLVPSGGISANRNGWHCIGQHDSGFRRTGTLECFFAPCIATCSVLFAISGLISTPFFSFRNLECVMLSFALRCLLHRVRERRHASSCVIRSAQGPHLRVSVEMGFWFSPTVYVLPYVKSIPTPCSYVGAPYRSDRVGLLWHPSFGEDPQRRVLRGRGRANAHAHKPQRGSAGGHQQRGDDRG